MAYGNFYYMVFFRPAAGKIWSSMCVGIVPDYDFRSVISAVNGCSMCKHKKTSGTVGLK